MSLSEIFMLPGVSGGPRLVISDASESFDFEANSHSFFVNSNLTWSWSSDVAWITSDEDTPQTGSQTFSYSVTENISTQRTGTITFTSGDITRTHTVTQGPYPILTIDDAAHTFDSDADSLTFNVTSNTDWTWFASEDWVTSSEAVFQNGNQAFTYSVTANTGAERTATITFVDVQAGVVTEVHSITQSAEVTPLLLDTYTGAVGFSLRKIRTAYTGDCIRVRRASDDAEQDIGFSGNDLDTAAIETFCSGTTGHVKTWYDQVGSNDAVKAVFVTTEPVIYESGAVVVNEHGLPAIRFFDDDSGVVGPVLRCSAWAVADAAWLAQSMVYSLRSLGSNPPIFYGTPLRSDHFNDTGRLRIIVQRTGGSVSNQTAAGLSVDTTTVRLDSADRTNVQIFLDTESSAELSFADRDEDASLGVSDIGNRALGSILSDTLMSELIGFTADESANNLAIRTEQYNYWTDSIPAPLTLSIDSASATYNEDAQSGSFEVTSNTDWTWTSSAAWLTSAESSPQNGNQTFSYSVSENTGTERVATITLSATGTNVIHTVTQDAAPVPPVDPDIEDFTEFDYVADMVASMDAAKGAGQVWYAQGYRYVELDSGATDQHLTTAGGVKLRALQDGSGAVTTEQLGWLPASGQQANYSNHLSNLDLGSVLTVTDSYDCDDGRVTISAGVNLLGAIRRYSGFRFGTQSGNERMRIPAGGGSVRRVKVLCDQSLTAASCFRIESDRYILDDLQSEHKALLATNFIYSSYSYIFNCEFWDAHFNLNFLSGKKQRLSDNYHTASWEITNYGEGIKTIQDPAGGTDLMKIYGCYFDRCRRDGVDLTGTGRGIKIVGNIFHLCGTGRTAESNGIPSQGIDLKIPSVGNSVWFALDHIDVSDNVFLGAGPVTTQEELDADTAENRWVKGIKGVLYSRNSYERKLSAAGQVKGGYPTAELFTCSTNERVVGTLSAGLSVERGSVRNLVLTSKFGATTIVKPFGVAWLDFANHIILKSASNAVNLIDWTPTLIGPKITGSATKFQNQYIWWTRLHNSNHYIHLNLSLSVFGPGDVLLAWSNGGLETPTAGRGIMVSSCFGKGITDVVQHTTGGNGLINDVYVLGNIVQAANLVNDPGTDIRTGLWIRQNTSDGANARTGAGTTSPVIEQNVGVS